MKIRGSGLLFWVAVTVAAAAFVFGAHAAPGEVAPPSANLRMNVKIPMRDGVALSANLFLPTDASGAQPVVFAFTPYTTDRYYIDDCIYYAKNGYACAIVDSRGRGNSGGSFVPFENDGPDGYDVVEWLAKQPWSNGKIGMFGFSYVGFTQWSTLKQFPPHLATIVPTAPVYPGYDFPLWSGNLFHQWAMVWLAAVSGATANSSLVTNSGLWAEELRDFYRQDRPFSQLDQAAGNPSAIFQRWTAHPYPDAYWNAMTPAAADYPKIHIPVLTITGSYDADQGGALHYYRQHMAYGNAADAARHYLVIGPWDHMQTHKPEAEFDGLTFGPASLVDMHLLHKQWFDWTMKDGPRPEFLKQRVAYYVAGLDQWKYAEHFEDVGASRKTFYLFSDGAADDVFHSGTLGGKNAGGAAFDAYTYDPLRFSPYAPEQARTYEFDCPTEDKSGINACSAMGIQGNGLVYHTAPLDEEAELSGIAKLSLWLEMDVPDTDIQISLDEVRVDGSIVHLTDAMQRARYRESRSEPRLVEPGKLLRYEISSFWFDSRRLAKRSRLRLSLMPPSPDFERNYNSGNAVEHETAKDAKVAHVRLYHDAQHESTLEVPFSTDH